MELQSFRALLGPRGQEALRIADAWQPKRADFLHRFQQLSKFFPAELARAALDTAILRGEAAAKFPFAGQMYFTREALEQSSPYEVSSYRSERYRGLRQLADLGCSIGGDTLSLVRVAPTTGVDRDALRLLMAQANARDLGLEAQASFILADLTIDLPFRPAQDRGIFFDPARREGHRRVHRVKAYQPPLSAVRNWLGDFPALGVKISPGVKLDELATYDAEVEFISLKGELKEAVLWFGPLKTAVRRATLLPGLHTLTGESTRADILGSQPRLSHPLDYLLEPDPAILRAGLVRNLAGQLSAAQLDPDIAYLTADRLIPNPFTRAWAVEAWFPFSRKRLQAFLRERGVGSVIVKKRGSPLEPEQLVRELRLSGDQHRVVFLTHLLGEPIVVVCFSPES